MRYLLDTAAVITQLNDHASAIAHRAQQETPGRSCNFGDIHIRLMPFSVSREMECSVAGLPAICHCSASPQVGFVSGRADSTYQHPDILAETAGRDKFSKGAATGKHPPLIVDRLPYDASASEAVNLTATWGRRSA
jgi:hypothetical protein